MPYESALAFLSTELSTCLQPGTGVSESDLKVSVKPINDEIVRFFNTDCQSARTCFCMEKNDNKSCDYLVLYKKEDKNKQAEVLCFLELKGHNFDHAVAQVCNTFKYVLAKLKPQIARDHH